MGVSQLYLEQNGAPARLRLSTLVGEAKGGDPLAPITVVVPSQYAGISLRRALAAGPGLLNVRFMVLPRLAEMIGAPALAEKGKVPLAPLLELAAIHATAAQMGTEGFPADTSHPGLHLSLARVFSQLDRLSHDETEALARADSLRRLLVRWYRLVRERVSACYTREELARAAARAFEAGKATGALRDLGFIVFYLIRDISPAETALLDAISKAGPCAVVLGLTFEVGPDASVLDLAQALEPKLGQTQKSESTQVNCGASHLLCASDVQEEVRWVIRQIAREAGGGLPFHRMAIAYRQADPYASLVPGQLRLAGIPVAGPDPRRLRDTPPGKLLLGLLEVQESDFRRDSVMHWLAESPVGLEAGNELASSELARWEVVSRKAGIVRGAGQWQERVTRYRDRLSYELAQGEGREDASPTRLRGLQAEVESAAGIVQFIEKLSSEPPPERAGWDAYAKWATKALRRYALDPESWPPTDRDAYDRVEKRIEELASLNQVMPETDVAGFQRMIEEALDAPAGRTGITGSGVFVAPVVTLQGMDFEVVYMVGMAEGAFPPAPPVAPLLPDHLREGAGLPSRQARRIEERASFLAAMAAGGKRVLSYSRTDSSAQREQYPSPWFLGQATRLRGSPVRAADVIGLGQEDWLTVIESPEHALRSAASATAADIHDYDVASVARWRARGLAMADHFLVGQVPVLSHVLAMDEARGGTEFTEWDGRVSKAAGRSQRLTLPRGRVYSPTQLEGWARCPFGYFLTHILRLSTLETPEETMAISALDRGDLMHRVLQRLVATCMEEGRLPGFGEAWDEGHAELLMAIAEEEFREAEARGITGKRLLWEIAREEILHDLTLFLQADSRLRAAQGLRPQWVEHKFGFEDDESLPAVKMSLPEGARLLFRGAIDRIDIDASGSRALVTDYKSGSSYRYRDMGKDPLGKGTHLQLPIYALAVRSALEGLTDISAQYWFITSKEGFKLRPVILERVEAQLMEVLTGIVSGIQSGVFPANPGESEQYGNCGYCDFDRICPSNRDLVWERKVRSPDLAVYTRLLVGATDSEAEE